MSETDTEAQEQRPDVTVTQLPGRAAELRAIAATTREADRMLVGMGYPSVFPPPKPAPPRKSRGFVFARGDEI